MTSEIPADLMATAKAVRAKLCIDCECTFDQGCGCLDALHEALNYERERCANIAESSNAWPQEGADIAAAIRQQASP